MWWASRILVSKDVVSYRGLKKMKDWGGLEDEEGKNWFKKKKIIIRFINYVTKKVR